MTPNWITMTAPWLEISGLSNVTQNGKVTALLPLSCSLNLVSETKWQKQRPFDVPSSGTAHHIGTHYYAGGGLEYILARAASTSMFAKSLQQLKQWPPNSSASPIITPLMQPYVGKGFANIIEHLQLRLSLSDWTVHKSSGKYLY